LYPTNTVDHPHKFSRKKLEWSLVILSSTLLGIWAVKDTIALRNILLVVGVVFSIKYMTQEWKYGQLKEQCIFWKLLPVFLILLSLIWVFGHYLFLSIEPEQQWEELRSTWLRACFATIIGITSGMVVRNRPDRFFFLWLGVFISFVFLFSQYIPRALSQQKLLVPDYSYYLFHLKFNVVLMGTIGFMTLNIVLFNNLYTNFFHSKKSSILYVSIYTLFTIAFLWAFVFIVDARNGLGLMFVIVGFWSLCALYINRDWQRSKQSAANIRLINFVILVSLLLALLFSTIHVKTNKGWDHFIEDFKIALQIERYQNWHNLERFGYPQRVNGQTVTPNNYERIAWAAAGVKGIMAYPQGVGLLAYPFERNPYLLKLRSVNVNSEPINTHSGWVEFGLAFGVPFLILIYSAMLIILFQATFGTSPDRWSSIGYIVLIFLVYAVGENSSKHGVEILYYLISFAYASSLPIRFKSD
jgi:hypothetical protein